MSELYRDYIDGKADEIVTALGGTITPAPANAELYRDFLERKFDDVINAINNVKVKSFKYTGDGQLQKTIKFPNKPIFILGIYHTIGDTTQNARKLDAFPYGVDRTLTTLMYISQSQNAQIRTVFLTYNDDEITLTGADNASSMNVNQREYIVYYI